MWSEVGVQQMARLVLVEDGADLAELCGAEGFQQITHIRFVLEEAAELGALHDLRSERRPLHRG